MVAPGNAVRNEVCQPNQRHYRSISSRVLGARLLGWKGRARHPNHGDSNASELTFDAGALAL